MISKLTVEQAGDLKGIPASILGKYGIEAINEACERLCDTCEEQLYDSFCETKQIIPLTLDGTDCPYYQKKEIESCQSK